ncbi:MAG: response regulator [Tissierellales bacterium]|nr:response regulator [Tissierellales bacterium]
MAVNILVVDDEINILELIKFNLELNNYKVYTAENGRKGIEKINQINFDLIILDLMMPEVDGIQLCKYVRGNEKFETIPIIMLTAKSTETDKIFGLEIGADDYITKPFSVKDLQARVKHLPLI